MKPSALFLFLALFWPGSGFPQYDSLLNMPYPQKVQGINVLYGQLVGLKDSAAIARKADGIRRLAVKAGDREMELEMDLFMAYHDAFFKLHAPAEVLRALQELIRRSGEEKIGHITVRALRILAEYYWHNLKNFELAFEQYLRIERELGALSPDDYPDMARDLLKIGEAYYFFRDYGQARRYLERVIKLPETAFSTQFINSARNTLGLCYQKEGRLDEADFYFRSVLQSTFPGSRSQWERIVNGNIGTSHYLRKQYDQAFPLLQSDYLGAEEDNDFGPAAGALIRLADIALERGDMSLSRAYISRARADIARSGQKERLMDLFPVASKWYSIRGDAVLTRAYLDSTVQAIRDDHERFSALKVLRAQQKINRQEGELKQAAYRLAEQKRTSERNMLVILLAGVCLAVAVAYYLQRKRRQADELKLQAAARELREFAKSITEKNKLIERLQSHQSAEDRNLLLQELQQSTILTEEDWVNFQRLFEKAHHDFFRRLKRKIPSATPAETRVLALAHLNLTTREMAGILGVGADTIRQHRSRIRRKLGEEVSLETLLADV